MKIAYLDCFAGMAGDMFLGALLDAGVPAEVLVGAAEALGLGASLRIERVDRSGIAATKVHVLENGRLAEGGDHGGVGEQAVGHEFARSEQVKTLHSHKVGHAHTHTHDVEESEGEGEHAHEHVHGRSLTEIRRLIGAARLQDEVKSFALRAFELLGHAEAKVHEVPVEQIHFHEVGAVDAIVDIAAAAAGVHYLVRHMGVSAWYCSAVNVGGGMVDCAHGKFPAPAPAAAELLRGFPTYSAEVRKELVTPTGAALLRVLEPEFGPQPGMRVEAIGYGAGTRDTKGFPNVVRLSVGERVEVSRGPDWRGDDAGETVTVMETALDDLSPQVIAYVAEKALAAGALDVMLTAVVMKKGRPGTLLTVLCDPAKSGDFARMILSETSTLGVRIRQDRRVCLERGHVAVETAYGSVRMKIGRQDGEERNAAPEFEDCRVAAAQHGVALKVVQQAAIAAYAGTRAR